MLDSGYRFVEVAAAAVSLPEPVYEFGALQVDGQVNTSDLRPLFAGKAFTGTDMRPGAGVDEILDLHELRLPDRCVGTAVLIDTLEHVERPWIAMKEVHRVLREDGVAVVVAPFSFPLHHHPDDYWRIAPSGMRVLLADFAEVHVIGIGAVDQPVSTAAVAFKQAPNPAVSARVADALAAQARWWQAVAQKLAQSASAVEGASETG